LRLDGTLDARDLVAQRQAPLLEAAHQEFVLWDNLAEPIDGRVQVGMRHAQLDQLTRRGVKIEVQGGGGFDGGTGARCIRCRDGFVR